MSTNQRQSIKELKHLEETTFLKKKSGKRYIIERFSTTTF